MMYRIFEPEKANVTCIL